MEASAVILLSMVCFVGLVDAFSTRRCLLHGKTCVQHCPRRMHPYHTRCDGRTMSQRTCSHPQTYVIGYTCGWSRCDCNGNQALDEELGYCVDAYECSAQVPLRKLRRQNRRRKKFRVPKVKAYELGPDPDMDLIREESRG